MGATFGGEVHSIRPGPHKDGRFRNAVAADANVLTLPSSLSPPRRHSSMQCIICSCAGQGDCYALTGDLERKIKAIIRSNLTARHVPSRMIVVNDIPYTRSGKKVNVGSTDRRLPDFVFIVPGGRLTPSKRCCRREAFSTHEKHCNKVSPLNSSIASSPLASAAHTAHELQFRQPPAPKTPYSPEKRAPTSKRQHEKKSLQPPPPPSIL